MSIFRRDNPDSPPSNPPAAREQPITQRHRSSTYIAAGSTVRGEISGATEVLVDGRFEGQLNLDNSVTIGREGTMEGDIQARTARIDGKVRGNVRGGDLVEVTATGSLEGDIVAARVVIAEGAFFKGKVEMGSKGRAPATSGPARPAEPAAVAAGGQDSRKGGK